MSKKVKAGRSFEEFKKIFDAMQVVNDKWSNGAHNFVTYMQQIDANYANFGWTPQEYYEELARYKKQLFEE